MKKINLIDKFEAINTHWDPKIVGELNGQQVKLVKFQGEFDWHKHDNEDEMFLVIKGNFEMQLRDKIIFLSTGEFIIVPRGVEHCPKAEEEVLVMLFEPAATLNTGDAKSNKTVSNPGWI
jgi:mannose-6-phosphate isomerase-like protein (cupin superfamily)